MRLNNKTTDQMIETAERVRQEASLKYDMSVEVIWLIPEKVFELCNSAYPNDRCKVTVGIPWHVPLEEEVIDLLTGAGFVITSTDFYESSGNRHYNMNHPDTGNKSDFFSDLEVWINPSQEGSTCEKVVVGTKEVDVYEVVCKENGAQ